MTAIEITFHLRDGRYVFASEDKRVWVEGENKEGVCARFMAVLDKLISQGVMCRVEAYTPLGETLTLIRATGAICRVGLRDPSHPEPTNRQPRRKPIVPIVDFREPSPRILAFDPTPAGLVTAPLRTAFKYLWKCMRDERFNGGDFRCEICQSVEVAARLIHGHEVYSFPDEHVIQLDRIIFICYRCHDAIHLERTRGRASEVYIEEIENHYCRVNGGLSRKELARDYGACFGKMLSIREFYGGSEAQTRLNYGPYQKRVDRILTERTRRRLRP